MNRFLAVANTGVAAVLIAPLRSAVTASAVICVMAPFLAGLGISDGVRTEAEISVASGADLYLNATAFGRPVPLPLRLLDSAAQIDGVTAVVPRIVGRVTLGKDAAEAVLVGIPLQKAAAGIHGLRGRLYDDGKPNEFVIGSQLARRLNLDVASALFPFYHSRSGERVSKVVGVFEADASLWEANVMLTSLETAAAVFDQPRQASSFLVYTRRGYQQQVKSALLRVMSGQVKDLSDAESPTHFDVVTRDDLGALLSAGLLHREGIFNLHFLLACAVGIMVILVCSGIGLSERRRDVGILKATGWQTDEILLRSAVESLMLCLGAAAFSVVIAYTWLQVFNGYWIASVFLSGVDVVPGVRVPFHLFPVPVVVSGVLCLVVVSSGTLYASWRAAITSPRDAMR